MNYSNEKPEWSSKCVIVCTIVALSKNKSRCEAQDSALTQHSALASNREPSYRVAYTIQKRSRSRAGYI